MTEMNKKIMNLEKIAAELYNCFDDVTKQLNILEENYKNHPPYSESASPNNDILKTKFASDGSNTPLHHSDQIIQHSFQKDSSIKPYAKHHDNSFSVNSDSVDHTGRF